MPNTITPAILKKRFTNRYNREVVLTTRQILNLWLATNPARLRGSRASATLEHRMTDTLRLMDQLERFTGMPS